jgi:hypothetical protein
MRAARDSLVFIRDFFFNCLEYMPMLGNQATMTDGLPKAELAKFLPQIKRRSNQLGFIFVKSIQLSPRREYKYRIHFIRQPERSVSQPSQKYIDFGRAGMSDYLQHGDEERRARFHARFRNNKGYNDRSSGLFYSRHLLW